MRWPERGFSTLDIYPTAPDLLYVHSTEREIDDFAPLDAFAFQNQSMPPIFVYQLARQSLWRACDVGYTARAIIEWLRAHAVDAIPVEMQRYISDTMSRHRELQLVSTGGETDLVGSPATLASIRTIPSLNALWHGDSEPHRIRIHSNAAWSLKRELSKLGYSIEDQRIPMRVADRAQFTLRDGMQLRTYQESAVHRFTATQDSGVMVLPCGAGKTVVGVAIAAQLQRRTLVLVPGEAAAQQWYVHFTTWTTLSDADIAIDDGKQTLALITITTYQRLTARTRRGIYHHLDRYTNVHFGLVIYDEVHLLPAPLFRLAALLQTDRALGLSATLIREDGRAADVYALVGSKLFEVHSTDLIRQGYLSDVQCIEVKVPLTAAEHQRYQCASNRDTHRIAADNPNKIDVVKYLCQRHSDNQVLIMGHYTSLLKEVSGALNCPMLDGGSTNRRRLDTYDLFRQGRIQFLVLSRIANMAVDLPNAEVAIQISGLFGSRQEEAQRLGRLLRPKQSTMGTFYSLVSEDTVEERTARHRQRYLVENGFPYDWKTFDEIIRERAD